jgi:hypothetical protein
MGLGIMPDDPDIDTLLAMPVPNANPDFADLLGRDVTLGDVVSKMLAYSPADGGWAEVNTPHPCGTAGADCVDPFGGITPASDDVELAAYQGLIVITRESVEAKDGSIVPVMMDTDDGAALARVDVAGEIVGSTNNGQPIVPTHQVSVGFNLIAPQVAGDTPFDLAFRPLPQWGLSFSAITSRRELMPSMDGGDLLADVVDDAAAQDFTQVFAGELAGDNGDDVQAEFAYWIFVQEWQTGGGAPATPTLEPTLD